MIKNPTHHHDDDNDDEIEALRRIAIESLHNKKPKEEIQQHRTIFPNHTNPIENNYNYHLNSFPPSRMPNHGFVPHNPYITQHQSFGPPAPHYNPAFPRAVQPIIRHEFTPASHVNPYMSQPQIFPSDYIPPSSVMDGYVPTPAIRLSPRSLEFVESNKKALLNANNKKRSKSPRRRHSRESRSRSRSRSPARRRSPYKKRSPIEVPNRNKRYRSKSPNSNFGYKHHRKNAFDRGSGAVNSPNRYSKKDNTRNSNGISKFDRIRSDSDKEEEDSIRSSQKSSQSEKEVDKANESVDEKNNSPSPVIDEEEKESANNNKEEESLTPPQLPKKVENRVKTQQEIEDELLASTDDENELDIEVDENELNFLEDDSESENEGRFKDKPSSNAQKETSSSKNHSTYSSKSYSSKSSNRSSRDDRFNRHVNQRSSQDNRNHRKSVKEEENRPALFKSTFTSIDDDDTHSKRSEKQIKLVRSSVSKAESNIKLTSSEKSSMKSVIATSDEMTSKSEPRKKKIMDRLGEYIGSKAKTSDSIKSSVSCKQEKRCRRSRYLPNKRQVIMSSATS